MITISRERRVDWPRIIDNLRRTGMTLQEVADGVGVSRSSIDGYCDDRCIEPSWWTGHRLLVLWSERVKLPWSDAPTRLVPESVARVLRDTA